MHSTVFVAIPAEKIGGDYSEENISKVVDAIVEPYYIETAPDGQAKMDGYRIGGRWSGFIATKPDAKSIIPSSNGKFAYEIADTYDLIMNGGQPGNYKFGSLEVVPVDGATKEDIIWDSIGRLQQFVYFMSFKMMYEKDPRMGGKIPDPYFLMDDGLGLNIDDGPVLVYKNGETFEENVERTGVSIDRLMMQPDAYIDKEGKWHTVNDLWMNPKYLDDLMKQDDPGDASEGLFLKMFYEYIDNELMPKDYFLVLDCHY